MRLSSHCPSWEHKEHTQVGISIRILVGEFVRGGGFKFLQAKLARRSLPKTHLCCPLSKNIHKHSFFSTFSMTLCTGHMARDLQSALFIGPIQEALSHVLLPIQTPNGDQLASHSLLLPHRYFSALYAADQGAFLQQWCGGSDDALESFWEGLRGTPALTGLLRWDWGGLCPWSSLGTG